MVRPPLEMFEQTEGSSWLTTSTVTETGLARLRVVLGTSAPLPASFLLWLLLLFELSARKILLKFRNNRYSLSDSGQAPTSTLSSAGRRWRSAAGGSSLRWAPALALAADSHSEVRGKIRRNSP